MDKFFITSTGTGIGKTFVTTALCRELIADGKKVLALKPVISGYIAGDIESDSALILQSLGKEVTEENVKKISPWRFVSPLSPNMAAQIEGRKILFNELIKFCKEHEKANTDFLFLEGVGGVCVPLDEKHTVLDLMDELKSWKIILVVGSYLGSISHTLTTVYTLAVRKIGLHAVIISESEENQVPIEEIANTLRNFLEESVIIFILPRQKEKYLTQAASLKRCVYE